jgi:hypothetical protein
LSLFLKNKNLEICIDAPLENYQHARFDWTGKIVSVRYQNIPVFGVEKLNTSPKSSFGRAFYNEFGIENAIGYDETPVGDWFHKIGVGLLKKEEGPYDFSKAYKIKPASFEVEQNESKITIKCASTLMNGYAYILSKEITLSDSGFTIHYKLTNTGEKTIKTEEYNHNFLAIDHLSMGKEYHLKFPFLLEPALFGEHINPENLVNIDSKFIGFENTPKEVYFFSNLSGSKLVKPSWELIHREKNIGIRETTSFKTRKINLWGCQHVISPELFFDVVVNPKQTLEWSRNYHLQNLG